MPIDINKLSKEETIKYHREMWDWLSNNPDKKKEDWPGWESFDFDSAESNSFCFCCAYDGQFEDICDKCPIVWPRERCYLLGSPFHTWDCSRLEKTRSALAVQIRDLPVKED